MAYLKKIYTITLLTLCCNQAIADEPLELFPDKLAQNKIVKEEKATIINKISPTQNANDNQSLQLKQVDVSTNINNNLDTSANKKNLDSNIPNLGESKADTIQDENLLNKLFSPHHASLWDRIRSGFKMANLDTSLVDNRTEWYAARPEYFGRINERAEKYLYHIVEELEKRKMPTELALLPIIESAFNPVANSSAKAAGIWQFMPKTGKYFNLQQNMFVDERRDVLSSTSAALDYLEKLYSMFGDWHLALAAYNWGEGSVAKAIARNQAQGLSTDYLSLNMPSETKYYVPKLQAVKNIIANPQKYNINLGDIPNHPYFITIIPNKDIDVDIFANLAEMSINEFKAINPSFNKKVIISATKPQILLPWDKAEKFKYNLQNYRLPLSSVTAITLSNKEKVESLAQRFGVDANSIRSINNIGKGFRFRAGSTVLMPKVGSLQNDISESIAENGSIKTEKDIPPFKTVFIYARKKDTWIKLANRYDVTLSQLKHWNRSSASLKKGQRLVLIVPYNKVVIAHKDIDTATIYKTKTFKSNKRTVSSKKNAHELRYKLKFVRKNKSSKNIQIAEKRQHNH